jgi:hypothetical protein
MKASWLQLLLLAAVLVPLAGCVGFIPVPHGKGYGQRIQHDTAEALQPGRTTRGEVIARLGTNHVALPYQRALAYPWEKGGGNWVLFAASLDAAGAIDGEWTHWRAFLVAFDERGVVAATAFKHLSTRKSLHRQLEAWYLKQHPPIKELLTAKRSTIE